MEKLVRNKKYKALDPFETINRARLALQKCDCFVVEKDLYSKIAKTYTSRVWLGDEDIFDLEFGTNGKGMTPRYSLASAYGEMMERLQNKLLFNRCDVMSFMYCGEYSNKQPELMKFLIDNGIDLEFQYSPDERWLSLDEIYKEAGKYLSEMFNVKEDELKQVIAEFAPTGFLPCAPCYSVLEDKSVYLPMPMILTACGSNGMCAGNTPKEAIIQGMSEIYERYASALVYFKKVKTPIIPECHFEGTEVLSKLIALREKGYDFDILDFSCGIGLPVVALRLIRKSDGAIAIRPGADPSPITALERCLTEMYQTEGTIDFRFRHTPVKELTKDSTLEEINEYYRNSYEAFHVGAGDWPDNVQTTERVKGFKGFSYPISYSDDVDLQYMLDIAKNLNRDVLIRDNSFLGFPAFTIILPGITECYLTIQGKYKALNAYYPVADNNISLASQLATTDIEGLKTFRKFLVNQVSKRKVTKVSPHHFFPIGLEMPDFILDLEQFINQLDLQVKYLEGNGAPIFTKKNWPNCYNCDDCAYYNDCRMLAVAKRLKSISELEKQNVRKQDKTMFL